MIRTASFTTIKLTTLAWGCRWDFSSDCREGKKMRRKCSYLYACCSLLRRRRSVVTQTYQENWHLKKHRKEAILISFLKEKEKYKKLKDCGLF
jgi:hypothetical protein